MNERKLKVFKKELDERDKKLKAQQKKFTKQKSEFEQRKKDFESEYKQYIQAKKKFEFDKKKGGGTGSSRPTTPRGGNLKPSKVKDAKLKKLEQDNKDLKAKLDDKSKQNRGFRKKINELEAEIAILKRQLKNAGKGKKVTDNSREIKQLKREIENLRKRLRMALRDLEKQSRYYQQQLKRFKDDQHKWINKQRNLNKNKKIVVKYCFIDDIRKIKVYRKGKRRIKVKTRDGGEVIIRDVDGMYMILYYIVIYIFEPHIFVFLKLILL